MPTTASVALDRFAAERCSAILRTPHENAVQPAMDAAIAGGFRIVEFTLNTPGALSHIERMTGSDGDPDLLVGAGTVLSVAEANEAVNAGASFLVSPVVDPDVIATARERDVLVIPGAATPTEALNAHRAGAQIVKVFPGPADGAAWIRAVRGPMPFLRLFPTSGVTLENATEHLEAGAFGVGFVNSLFRPEWIEGKDFASIERTAHSMVAAAHAAPTTC